MQCKEHTACQCDGCSCKNNWGRFECKCKADRLYIKEQDVCIEEDEQIGEEWFLHDHQKCIDCQSPPDLGLYSYNGFSNWPPYSHVELEPEEMPYCDWLLEEKEMADRHWMRLDQRIADSRQMELELELELEPEPEAEMAHRHRLFEDQSPLKDEEINEHNNHLTI
ncbi:hypothetical protein Q3G72_034689 [Acer saccharum]|nr:hypothetical protein Q3G72_034689 [Acer saccharum]